MTAPIPIAITGVGSVTPLAVGAKATHDAWMAGRCGIEDGFGRCLDFVPEDRLSPRELRRTDRFVQLSLVAAEEAVEQAWGADLPYHPERIACVIATAISGQPTYVEEYDRLRTRGPQALRPLRVLLAAPNGAAVLVAMRYGLRGEAYGLSGACAGGLQAIGAALRMIRAGAADAAVVGGADAEFTGLAQATYAGLGACSPTGICRPFDRRRDGMVPGEGAGMLVIENLEKARARGARVLAEILGYGAGSDAHHLTSPHAPGQARTIELALEDARITPDELTYINAHGTGTELNDITETTAIKSALGDAAYGVPISSLKSAIGHTQGAAGAVEAVGTVLALRDGVAPPTLALEELDERLDLDYVPLRARPLDFAGEGALVTGLTNSFGLGGHNACLVVRARVESSLPPAADRSAAPGDTVLDHATA